MNFPNDKDKPDIPEEAAGNPVYEQTRQDMPLWCCGRHCGRNSRIVVFTLAIIGIACSVFTCLSPNYFSFVSLRNDTFLLEEKNQPKPFEYATEANVGMFKYEILDVFDFPWPASKERQLFEYLMEQEVRRLQNETDVVVDNTDINTNVFNATADVAGNGTSTNDTEAPLANATDVNATDANATDANSTEALVANATDVSEANATGGTGNDTVPGVGPGSVGGTSSPTTTPTQAPTITNPNDIVAETVDLGVVKTYPEGTMEDDSLFTNSQRGAIMGPVFAFLGTVFGLVELCCCTYKCSWLPTALFLYLAFMFQMFTLFLFLSEDWCKYDQDCALGLAGWTSAIAVICYMLAQSLVCCSPRPPPIFNCCKKPPEKKKKKKKKKVPEEDENEGLTRDYDDPDYDDQQDNFRDEPNDRGYVDPYHPYAEGSEEDDDEYDYGMEDDDVYDDRDNDTYAEDTFGGDNQTQGDDTYADGSVYTSDDDYRGTDDRYG
jgi:hypothetical protein